MAKKKSLSEDAENIKKSLEEGSLIIGTERTIKALQAGSAHNVYITINCPDAVKQDINHLASLSDATIIHLPYLNTELGTMCKKTFSISVVAT